MQACQPILKFQPKTRLAPSARSRCLPRELPLQRGLLQPANIDFSDATRLLTANTYPEIGDLVLARVVRTGQHRRIELPCGRRSTMHVGDEIVVAFGARYASDQFEAGLPVQLGACHLVAAGGVAASAYCKHSRMKNPTEIATIGILATG